MPEITNFRHGAILNSHHGIENENGLKIRLEGLGTYGHPVEVNGVRAEMDGRRFTAEIELKKKINEVTVSELTPYGRFSQELTLVWDKKSFKRYGFYIDDHSFLFTDLTKERPKRAFDHFYLKHLKQLNEKYGMKVTLNSFFRNDHEPFTLDLMPDIWKSEFRDNSDWLKFSFHAKSEFPDRPYIESSAEEYGRDYDEVRNEIIRFAGEESFTQPLIMHWGNIHPAVAEEMIRRGSRCNSVAMRPKIMGGPSLASRMKGGDIPSTNQQGSCVATHRTNAAEAFGMYYDHEEENSYVINHCTYYEPNMKIYITGRSTCCCNLVPLDKIEPQILERLATREKYGCDFSLCASHEQYSFPYYPNYLPDHGARIEAMARIHAERGYTSVFPNDGLLGNMSWE